MEHRILALGLVAACGSVQTTPDAAKVPETVVNVTSSFANSSYQAGSVIPIEVTFSGPVTVVGTPQLTLDSGAPPVAYTSGSGTRTLTFAYTVACGESADHLDYVDSSSLALAGGTIRGAVGDAVLTLPAPGAPGSLGANKMIAIVLKSMTFDFTGALETFLVPTGCHRITIDAFGAEGGTSTGEMGGLNFPGGKGAEAKGTFVLADGQMISLLVGGIGGTGNCGSGGGGGSFAVSGTTLLLAAGGGGGGFHCIALGGVNGDPGNATTTGGSGVCDPNRTSTPGGMNGAGGSSFFGGGGGGFMTAGTSTQDPNGGGKAFPGAGGTVGGGFGGGGGHFAACCGGSGGGGGFSGGGGGTSDGCAGGGGGSQNTGMNPVNTAGVRMGSGQIIVSW